LATFLFFRNLFFFIQSHAKFVVRKKLFLIFNLLRGQLRAWLTNLRNIILVYFCIFIFSDSFQFTECVWLETYNWHLSLFLSFIILNLNNSIHLIWFFTHYYLSFILIVYILDLSIYFWYFFQISCNFLPAFSSFSAFVVLGSILILFFW
jgi:hypothetical protein